MLIKSGFTSEQHLDYGRQLGEIYLFTNKMCVAVGRAYGKTSKEMQAANEALMAILTLRSALDNNVLADEYFPAKKRRYSSIIT